MTDNTANSDDTTDYVSALQSLGDPSGRQDSNYWDDWFEIVGRQRCHEAFEWYSDVNEVLRVISYHLTKYNHRSEENRQKPPNLQMFHPGSGTSLLPIELAKFYPHSVQVVADISKVALNEIQQLYNKVSPENKNVEFREMDILNRQLPFESSTFDCWIDKGFVDALFSEEKFDDDRQTAAKLFYEASRILKSKNGFALVVTLGEEHSIRVIIDNWISGCNSEIGWSPVIHVWDLMPISGNNQPFCFVMTKSETNNSEKVNEVTLICHSHANIVKETTVDRSQILEQTNNHIQSSRELFRPKRHEKKVPKVLATIEIKPYDTETDLSLLGETLRRTSWKRDDGQVLKPLWHPVSDREPQTFQSIVPVGFGISKLVLQCIINSEHLDTLVDLITEWENDDFPEAIQSVDVDWTKTIPIASIDRMIGTKQLQMIDENANEKPN